MDRSKILHGGPLDGAELKESCGTAAILYLAWCDWENGTFWLPVKQKTKRKAIYHWLRGRFEFIRTERA